MHLAKNTILYLAILKCSRCRVLAEVYLGTSDGAVSVAVLPAVVARPAASNFCALLPPTRCLGLVSQLLPLHYAIGNWIASIKKKKKKPVQWVSEKTE